MIHTFVVIDKHYSEAALVSLSSFKKFNPGIHVHVYCMNFTQDEFLAYVTTAISEIGLDGYNFIKYDFEMFDTSAHNWNIFYIGIFKIIAAKFKIMSEIDSEYFIYFDVDTIFNSSISELFTYLTPTFEFGGVRYTEHQPDVNCGLLLVKNKHIDYFKQFKNFFDDNHSTYFNLDEAFLTNLYKNHITYFERKFSARGDDIEKNPIMVHYLGPIKPFEINNTDSPVYMVNTDLFHYWYDYFDTIKHLLSSTFVEQVERCRTTINQPDYKIFNPNKSIISRLTSLYKGKSLHNVVKYFVNQYNSKIEK